MKTFSRKGFKNSKNFWEKGNRCVASGFAKCFLLWISFWHDLFSCWRWFFVVVVSCKFKYKLQGTQTCTIYQLQGTDMFNSAIQSKDRYNLQRNYYKYKVQFTWHPSFPSIWDRIVPCKLYLVNEFICLARELMSWSAGRILQ